MKLYVLSQKSDKELEQIIADLGELQLKTALYGIARGWNFDEVIEMVQGMESKSDKDENTK